MWFFVLKSVNLLHHIKQSIIADVLLLWLVKGYYVPWYNAARNHGQNYQRLSQNYDPFLTAICSMRFCMSLSSSHSSSAFLDFETGMVCKHGTQFAHNLHGSHGQKIRVSKVIGNQRFKNAHEWRNSFTTLWKKLVIV